jgi:RND superfamily putative drug exporter
MVLVPATMSLLGRANWWLPTWLDRILPHIDFEATPRDAEPVDNDNDVDDERELVAV